MVNVGKYAIPTDCMGYEVFFSTDMSHQLTSVQLYSSHTRMSMELSNYLVSWVVTY